MTRYSLIINPFAEDDIIEAKNWYKTRQENLDTDFISEIKKTILRITENPFQYPKVKNPIRMAVVERFPFIIFFYLNEMNINVFAVFHTSRNPANWKKRLK